MTDGGRVGEGRSAHAWHTCTCMIGERSCGRSQAACILTLRDSGVQHPHIFSCTSAEMLASSIAATDTLSVLKLCSVIQAQRTRACT
ncbi:unnamed protein product [Soboliphyme baturini]|uniref:Uncharacterized protein n=1 Tax=Soboliphyme baturini TaxID=241478 RepID=A0A183IVC0_9BILA|nr:unnamed protein product [Soboliphyme baturini]